MELTDEEIVRILTEEVGLPAIPSSPPLVRLVSFNKNGDWQLESILQQPDWFAAPAGLNRELPPEPPTFDEPEKLELVWQTDDGIITLHKNEDGMMRLGLKKWGSALYFVESELEQLRKMLNERHFCDDHQQEVKNDSTN